MVGPRTPNLMIMQKNGSLDILEFESQELLHGNHPIYICIYHLYHKYSIYALA